LFQSDKNEFQDGLFVFERAPKYKNFRHLGGAEIKNQFRIKQLGKISGGVFFVHLSGAIVAR